MAQRRGRETSRGSGVAGGRADRRDGARRPAAGRRGGRDGGPPGTPPGGLDPAVQRERLREVVEPVVNAAGYDVDGLALSRAGRRHLVRLTIDGDGGVSLDAVASVSRAVSVALDAAEADGGELFAGEYELQVSSPGVDRPLTLPRHWRRNVGRLVQVRAGDRQLTGRILGADDGGIVLDVGGTHHELRHEELGPGKVQLEFTRLAALSDAEVEDMLEPLDDDDDQAGSADTGDDEQEEDEE